MFILPTDTSNTNKNANIPFVEFIDVDLDGMIDMVFYHDQSVYTYYNQHAAKPIPQASFEAENLCKTEEDVEADIDANKSIFMNYNLLTTSEIKAGGNSWVTI